LLAMGKQIKVCHVLHGIVGGGSEQVVLNYCSRMPEISFDVLYQYEPNPQILERFVEAGFNCIRIPDKVHHPIKHMWMLFSLFKNNRYDVVHSHLDWFLNAYVMLLAMLAGVPKRIAHHHQAYGCHSSHRVCTSLKELLYAVLRIPNKMFATHWLACGRAAAENGWGKNAASRGKVLVLPNAIDPERFKFNADTRAKIRNKYNIAEDYFVVGHVGRFFPQKNHRFLIDVFAEIVKLRSNSKLLLLGDGPLQNEIQKKVEMLGLSDKVIFVGLQKDPAPFYSAMDVFCFPSLWEGLPLTLVEAQYNGLPAVASDAITDEVCISCSLERLQKSVLDEWTIKIIAMSRPNTLNENADKFNLAGISKILEKLYD